MSKGSALVKRLSILVKRLIMMCQNHRLCPPPREPIGCIFSVCGEKWCAGNLGHVNLIQRRAGFTAALARPQGG